MRSYLSALGTFDMKDTQPPLHKLWNALFVLGTYIFIWMTSKGPSYLKALSVEPQVNPEWSCLDLPCAPGVKCDHTRARWGWPVVTSSHRMPGHDMSRHTPARSQRAHDTGGPCDVVTSRDTHPCLRHAVSHSRGHRIADTQHRSLEQSINVLQAVILPNSNSSANAPECPHSELVVPLQSGFLIPDLDYHQLTNVSPVWPLFWLRWRLNLDTQQHNYCHFKPPSVKMWRAVIRSLMRHLAR